MPLDENGKTITGFNIDEAKSKDPRDIELKILKNRSGKTGSKIAYGGCGLGAHMCGFSKKDALRVGTSIVARGEVAMIIADKGVTAGLMDASLLTVIIILFIITSLLTPILLKYFYRESNVKACEQ